MLEAAFDAGIRHFDVAPMYGFGQAESCVGEFLGRHRADVTVTTKYGIPPPKNQGLIGLARTVARPLVKALPGLKRGLSSAAGKVAQPAEKASFTPQQAQESLDRSLAELQTDHIDVWLLHEATVDDLRDDSLRRLLEDAVAAGKIGAFGVGSERSRIEALVAQRPEYCGIVQFEWSVMDQPVPAIKSFPHSPPCADGELPLAACEAGGREVALRCVVGAGGSGYCGPRGAGRADAEGRAGREFAERCSVLVEAASAHATQRGSGWGCCAGGSGAPPVRAGSE